jgi:hypothetical protein
MNYTDDATIWLQIKPPRDQGVVNMRIKLTSVLVDDQDKALQFIPVGDAKFLTVVSPEEPDSTELLLEPSDNPAAKVFKKALVEQGIAATAFQVDDIQKDYNRLTKLGVKFTLAPTNMGPVTQAVFDDTCGNLIQIYQV